MFNRRRTVLVLGDIAMLALSFIGMVLIRFNLHTQHTYIVLQAKLFVFIFIVWLIIFFIFDLYTQRRINPNPRNIGFIILAMLTNGALAILIFYLFPASGISPKTNLAILSVIATVLLIAWRRLFYTLFTSRYTRTIGILGIHPLMTHLREELTRNPHIGKILWQLETLPENPETIAPVDLLIAETVNPHDVVTLARTVAREALPFARAYELLFDKIHISLMSNEKAMAILAQQKSAGMWTIYRVVEIVIASALLIITLPLSILAMIAIAIEDGAPIFFKQLRAGKNSIPFTIYKFRSMKVFSPDGSAETTGVQWAEKNDPRITRVGRIIRKTHIDEIPQMWNIIRGDLTLIGPRAERPEFIEQLEATIPYYYLRQSIKPGFTGWAQIKFRYARSLEDSREKFEYDLYYLSNQNPVLDIGILLKTIQIIFTH